MSKETLQSVNEWLVIINGVETVLLFSLLVITFAVGRVGAGILIAIICCASRAFIDIAIMELVPSITEQVLRRATWHSAFAFTAALNIFAIYSLHRKIRVPLSVSVRGILIFQFLGILMQVIHGFERTFHGTYNLSPYYQVAIPSLNIAVLILLSAGVWKAFKRRLEFKERINWL